jgi:ribosomal protein S18 acetylase RimI-like enzyme
MAMSDIKIVRSPNREEYDTLYLMGYDVWGGGVPKGEFLKECRESPKYQRGEWMVLDTVQDGIASSLLIHKFESGIFGIGSIATQLASRNKGHASLLIAKVVDLLENARRAQVIYLYSDVNPAFYERFGFSVLSQEYQTHSGSVCMRRLNPKSRAEIKAVEPPPYF